MKAVRLHKYGHADQLKIEEIEIPKLHAGEILIEVKAIGVNPVDFKIREGEAKKRFPQSLPTTVGQDFAGIVKKAGAGTIGFKKGDRVYGFAPGAYAEYVVAKCGEIAKIPDSISFEDAASVPTAGLTAWQILVDYAEIAKGDRVLIHGAGGAVGSFACQIAKWKGATVIATASKQDFEYLKSLGVNEVIDYAKGSFETRVSPQVDIVLDLVGQEVAESSLKVLREGGTFLSTVGSMSQDQLRAKGFNGGSMMMTKEGGELAEIAQLIDQGVLNMRLSQIMEFEQAAEAQDLVGEGHPHGKIVLSVPEHAAHV